MNKKGIMLISEFISAPFDEGLKTFLFNLIGSIQKNANAAIVTRIENRTEGLNVRKIKLNKLFLNGSLYSVLKEFSPEIILYVPEASCTFNSFVRAKVLKLMNRCSTVVMIGAQYRTFSTVQSFLVSTLLRPDLLLLLSKRDEPYYQKKGINVRILPPAVDNNKFSPPKEGQKRTLRLKYNLPLSKKIILHVGHIKVNRNIEWLTEVQKLENTQVVIVGSTAFTVEDDLKDRLLKAGIYLIDRFVPDIAEVFKMSDIYVFPVMSKADSIDMPMSVLEAMACNLPVMTTRFGGLTDHFGEDKGFKYFNSINELVQLIKNMEWTEVHNSEKIAHLSWDCLTQTIIRAVDDLKCQKDY